MPLRLTLMGLLACGAAPIECPEGFIASGEVCLLADAGTDVPPSCEPGAELCNDLDDDCDGGIDEDVTEPCGTNVGACVEGVRQCTGGVFGACDAEGPGAETCDGAADEDCDGSVDEQCACQPGELRECGTDIGVCAPGIQRCVGGSFGGCDDAVVAADETCDGRDEDCDGRVDEGSPVDGGECGSDVGVCRPGRFRCSGGTAMCEGARGPREEPERSCNGEDDDCDGGTDEMLLRPYYRDADMDGRGDPAVTMMACAPPAGFVSTMTDCDDACPSCGESSPEICDRFDNDCDDVIDEGVTTAYYSDADRDGYGAGPALHGCEDDIGLSTRMGDCAPNDADAYPGASAYHGTPVSGTGGYDYNCDRMAEREHTAVPGVLIDAHEYCLSCPNESTHYLGNLPACGSRVTTFVCEPASGRCLARTTDNQLVRCR